MGKLLDNFKKYFDSASEEQKKKDWEELKVFNECGPVCDYGKDFKTGKLSKTKIRRIMFAELLYCGFHPKNIKILNGYFLFDFGENSVVHFDIKEIPYWRFAFWINTDKEKKEYVVSVFGEKKDWIDKFKPNCCHIANESVRIPMNYTKKNEFYYGNVTFIVYKIASKLAKLKNNRRMAEYVLYNGAAWCDKGFLKFTLDQIWYYDIQKPLQTFYEEKIAGKLYNVLLVLIWMKWHKYIKPRWVESNSLGGLKCWPEYTCGVEYSKGWNNEEISDEEIHRIYDEINDSKIVDFIRKHSHFHHFKNAEDKRGFYYPRQRKDEEGEQ